LVISFAEQIARHEEASEEAAAEAEHAERHHNGDLQQQLAHSGRHGTRSNCKNNRSEAADERVESGICSAATRRLPKQCWLR
jgi:hypothetical protein